MTHALTRTDYFTGPDGVRRDIAYAADLTPAIVDQADELINRVNALLGFMAADRVPLQVDPGSGSLSHSGWRPPSVNAATKGAAAKSKHMIGAAVDLYDPTGALDAWCMSRLDLLADAGLWLEHPSATVGWCHLQYIAPRSGKRVFLP